MVIHKTKYFALSIRANFKIYMCSVAFGARNSVVSVCLILGYCCKPLIAAAPLSDAMNFAKVTLSDVAVMATVGYCVIIV